MARRRGEVQHAGGVRYSTIVPHRANRRMQICKPVTILQLGSVVHGLRRRIPANTDRVRLRGGLKEAERLYRDTIILAVLCRFNTVDGINAVTGENVLATRT